MPQLLIENHLPGWAVFVISVTLQFPVLAQSTEGDECVCDSSFFSKNYAVAERIFNGRILSGQLDDNSESIVFEVGVISTVRGKKQSRIKLSTSLSQRCSIDVYAGSEMVFILGADDRLVSRCDMPVDYRHLNAGLLMKALAFVEHYEGNRRKARRVLVDDLMRGADVSNLRKILNMAYLIDPTEPVFESSTILVHRDLEVNVKNDKVVSHVWR